MSPVIHKTTFHRIRLQCIRLRLTAGAADAHRSDTTNPGGKVTRGKTTGAVSTKRDRSPRGYGAVTPEAVRDLFAILESQRSLDYETVKTLQGEQATSWCAAGAVLEALREGVDPWAALGLLAAYLRGLANVTDQEDPGLVIEILEKLDALQRGELDYEDKATRRELLGMTIEATDYELAGIAGDMLTMGVNLALAREANDDPSQFWAEIAGLTKRVAAASSWAEPYEAARPKAGQAFLAWLRRELLKLDAPGRRKKTRTRRDAA